MDKPAVETYMYTEVDLQPLKPGKVRICLDCREVNASLKLELISSLDLKDAYWQVPLVAASRDKTAFMSLGRPLFQFKDIYQLIQLYIN